MRGPLRVSMDEQVTENQEPDIDRLVDARGFDVVARYLEKKSTKKHRPEFERLLADAHTGRFDVVVVWALDRFGCDTIGNMIAVRDIDRLGVQLVSVRESWLDTTGPTLVAIFSWVAEQERERRSERTKAGLARVRDKGSSGKPIGRPRWLDDAMVARVRELAAGGQSSRQIAVALKVPRGRFVVPWKRADPE